MKFPLFWWMIFSENYSEDNEYIRCKILLTIVMNFVLITPSNAQLISQNIQGSLTSGSVICFVGFLWGRERCVLWTRHCRLTLSQKCFCLIRVLICTDWFTKNYLIDFAQIFRELSVHLQFHLHQNNCDNCHIWSDICIIVISAI